MKQDYILGGPGAGADASTTQTSVPKEFGDLIFGSIQVDFSAAGTLNGTMKLQASLDNVTYADISGSSTAVTAGNPSPIVYNQPDAGYRFIRAVWTPSAGTGTIVIQAIVKETPIPRG